MKNLVSCLIALPFITSCSVQEEYYEPGYYAPPPPRVEVHPNHHHGYRPASQVQVYQNHPGPRGSAVIVTPRGSRSRVEVHGGPRQVVRDSRHSQSHVEIRNRHNGRVVTRSHSETDVQVHRKIEEHANGHSNVVVHP